MSLFEIKIFARFLWLPSLESEMFANFVKLLEFPNHTYPVRILKPHVLNLWVISSYWLSTDYAYFAFINPIVCCIKEID